MEEAKYFTGFYLHAIEQEKVFFKANQLVFGACDVFIIRSVGTWKYKTYRVLTRYRYSLKSLY